MKTAGVTSIQRPKTYDNDQLFSDVKDNLHLYLVVVLMRVSSSGDDLSVPAISIRVSGRK